MYDTSQKEFISLLFLVANFLLHTSSRLNSKIKFPWGKGQTYEHPSSKFNFSADLRVPPAAIYTYMHVSSIKELYTDERRLAVSIPCTAHT
jgi:hypothetical protein